NRLVETVGCPPPGRKMELATTYLDERSADEVWSKAGIASSKEVICLNPGAAFGTAKHWPAESFAQLGRALVERRGAAVLVLCGPSERSLAEQIVKLSARPGVYA